MASGYIRLEEFNCIQEIIGCFFLRERIDISFQICHSPYIRTCIVYHLYHFFLCLDGGDSICLPVILQYIEKHGARMPACIEVEHVWFGIIVSSEIAHVSLHILVGHFKPGIGQPRSIS